MQQWSNYDNQYSLFRQIIHDEKRKSVQNKAIYMIFICGVIEDEVLLVGVVYTNPSLLEAKYLIEEVWNRTKNMVKCVPITK